MKKKILITALACGLMFSFSGCGKVKVEGFELSHYDGSDFSNGYDSDLLYKNTSEFLGGDSGVIWVSEEEDPEYGGYFYQYMSECASVNNGGIPDDIHGDIATDSSTAAYTTHIAISRSKDMYDWELCGVLNNGYGLKAGMKAFTEGGIWAPETIRDPKTGKYFMYFGGRSSAYYREHYEERYGSEPVLGVNNQVWVAGIAVSDTPVGPFELVTSEKYYGGKANLNGEYLTEEAPAFDFVKWYGADCAFNRYCTDLAPFFDENGDLYVVFNAQESSIDCWGIKMKDMVTPDYSTITLLMTAGGGGNPYAGDDGEADSSKPWRDGKIAAPVRVEYKGKAANNSAITPVIGEDNAHYGVNTNYINDPQAPRYKKSSYIEWEEWQDGTPNTEMIEADGKTVANPAYNSNSDNSKVREGVQVISHKDKNGRVAYYLTYTYTGVKNALYNVHFAVASSPLGNIKGEEYTAPKGKEFSMSLGVDVNNDYMSNLGHVDYVNVDGEWWIAHWEWTVPFGSDPKYDIGRLYALSPMTWFDDPSVDYYLPLANGPTQYLQAKPCVATGYKNIAGEASVKATNVQGDTLKYLTDGYTVTKSMYSDYVLQVKKKTEITLTFDSPKTVRGILIYNSYNYENAFSKIAAIQFDLAERPEWYTGGGKGLSCYIKDLGFPKAYKENEKILYSGVPSVATFNEIKVNSLTITISDHLGNANTLNIAEIMVLGK